MPTLSELVTMEYEKKKSPFSVSIEDVKKAGETGFLETRGQEYIGSLMAGPYAIPPQPSGREYAGKTVRLATEMGAGVAAAALTEGASVPVTVGRIGRLIQAGIRASKVGGAEAAASLASEAVNPSEEPLKRAAVTGTVGAVTEGLSGPALKLAGKVIKGGTRLVEGGEEAIRRTLKAGGLPTPGPFTTNRALDIIENVSRSSFLGGGSLSRQIEGNVGVVTKAAQDFAEAFGTGASREAIEDLTKQTLRNAGDAFRAEARRIYASVDLLNGNAKVVDMSSILKEAEDLAKRGLKDPKLQKVVKELRSRIKPAEFVESGVIDAKGKAIMREIPAETKITFADAADLRSDLLRIGRQGEELVAEKAQGAGKRLGSLLDQEMNKAAKSISKEALDEWRAAGKFWKSGKETFNSALIKNLTKSNPQSVFKAAVKNQSPREIRRVRNIIEAEEKRIQTQASAIKDPVKRQAFLDENLPQADLWGEIQGEWLRDLFDRSSMVTEGGQLSGSKILGNLKRMGDAALREMFSAEQIASLRGWARTLEINQGGVGKEIPGRVWIQLTQAGALGAVLLGIGRPNVGTVGILAGPAVAARLLRNKTFVEWATIGTKASISNNQRAMTRAVAQMVAIAVREGANLVDYNAITREPGKYAKAGMRTPVTSFATFGGPRSSQEVRP